MALKFCVRDYLPLQQGLRQRSLFQNLFEFGGSETIFHYNKDGEDEKWNIKDEKTRW